MKRKSGEKKYALAQRSVRQFFGDLEVVDAKTPLTLLPTEADFANAVKNDPSACGFAKTCQRLLHATKVLFFKAAVYMDHVGPDGVRRVYRYKPTKAVYDTIEAFDDGKLKRGVVLRAFVLRAPSPSATLLAHSRARRQWRQTDSGKAIEAARHAVRHVNGIERDIGNTKERLERLEQSRGPDAPTVVQTKTQLRKLRTRLAAARESRDDKIERAADARRHHGQGKQQPRRRHLDNSRRGGRFFWNIAA